MNRRLRRISTALIAMLALLMSQLAVATHVCAIMGASPAAAEAKMAPDCADPVKNLNACERHCSFGSSAVDLAKPVPAPDLMSGPVLRVGRPFVPSSAAARWLRATPLPPQPPPAILFSVLLI
jgi:hypothetical protein